MTIATAQAMEATVVAIVAWCCDQVTVTAAVAIVTKAIVIVTIPFMLTLFTYPFRRRRATYLPIQPI